MKTHLRPLHPEIFNELILLEQEVQSQWDLLSDQRKLNEKKAEKYPSQSPNSATMGNEHFATVSGNRASIYLG